MHSTSRVAYSPEESLDVKIDSLYLEGASGKVVVSTKEWLALKEIRHGSILKFNNQPSPTPSQKISPAHVATLGLAMVCLPYIFATGRFNIMVIGGLD